MSFVNWSEPKYFSFVHIKGMCLKYDMVVFVAYKVITLSRTVAVFGTPEEIQQKLFPQI